MVDVPASHPGDGTREYIAYLLFLHLANIERKNLEKGEGAPTRKWALDTYAECLTTVSNPESRTIEISRAPSNIPRGSRGVR